MQIEELYRLYQKNPSVKTDTRQLKKGDIFFALKGPSFNGNTFAEAALANGAAYAIIDDPAFQTGERTILVNDSLDTLQALAKYHRQQLNIPVIGITGSNGKTTTKELIHAVLSTTFKTYTTEGNLNNHIGVPLTLLKIREDAEIAVVEMGANHIGEIASYCTYALPSHGLITNCGKAHLEGFGGEEGVKKGKGELFDHLRTLTHGHAFVMWDFEYLRDMSKGISGIIKYGTTEDAHIAGRILSAEPFLDIEVYQGFGPATVKTQLVGDYNLPNVLAAITVGKFFRVAENKILDAISSYTPTNSRSQLIKKDGNQIILDAYNANPSSMKAAIDNFSRLEADHKIVILGSMAELGEATGIEHRQLVDLINKNKWHQVVLVGDAYSGIPGNYIHLKDSKAAAEWFRQQHIKNAHILIKGSRSMKMEKILE